MAILLSTFMLMLIPFAILSPTNAAERIKLFGTREFRSEGLVKFPKWQDTLTRFNDEKSVTSSKCESSFFRRCNINEWRDFLDDIANTDKRWQIDLVHKHINETRYIVDPINWGKNDYWATPFQFLDRDGDCEDYALLKRRMLISRGWPVSSLLLTVVRDEKGDGHAVLTARTKQGDFILDNKVEQLRLWNQTPYEFVMRQSYLNPQRWMALDARHTPVSAVLSGVLNGS